MLASRGSTIADAATEPANICAPSSGGVERVLLAHGIGDDHDWMVLFGLFVLFFYGMCEAAGSAVATSAKAAADG